jgi:hypothetical protein
VAVASSTGDSRTIEIAAAPWSIWCRPAYLPINRGPFSLIVEDPALTSRLNGVLFRATGDVSGRADATRQATTVSFEYQAAGLHVRKDYRFDPKNYVVAFSASVMNGEQALNPTIAWGPGLGDVGARAGGGSFFTGNYVQPPQAIYHKDGSVERIKATSVAQQPVHEGAFRFAGIDDHYFPGCRYQSWQRAARVQARDVTRPGQDRAPSSWHSRSDFRNRRRTCVSSSGRSSSMCCAR